MAKLSTHQMGQSETVQALLVFSGGQTRAAAGPRDEGEKREAETWLADSFISLW